jgi:hypothetical protein
MRYRIYSPLRWLAIGLALVCVWLDFNLREPPRPQLAQYEWRRTVSGWEELPRWEAPPEESPARPFVFAGVLFAATAVALSLPFASRRQGQVDGSAGALAAE